MSKQTECGFCDGGKIKFQQIHFDGRQDTRGIAACPYCEPPASPRKLSQKPSLLGQETCRIRQQEDDE